MITNVLCLLLVLGAAGPAAAEVGTIRIRGSRYVAGVEERISCSAHAVPPNRWHRDGPGLRRFELAASCPLAADLEGVVFAGREDPIVVYGLPTRRAIVVATADGALVGAASAELRRHVDGSATFERGRLAYHAGPVTFDGEYKMRCDPSANPCGP